MRISDVFQSRPWGLSSEKDRYRIYYQHDHWSGNGSKMTYYVVDTQNDGEIVEEINANDFESERDLTTTLIKKENEYNNK